MRSYVFLFVVLVMLLTGCTLSDTQAPTELPPTPEVTTPELATATDLPLTPEVSTPDPSTATLPPAGQEMLSVFPFAQGAAWTYQVTLDYAAGSGPQHWEGTATETVIEATPHGENWVFHTVIEGPPADSPVQREHFYVTKGGGLYDLFDAETAAAATNPEAVEYARYQILAWPFEIGQMWGDPDALATGTGFDVWVVDAIMAVDAPAGHYENCAMIIMVTNPDTTFRWFCPGTGFAKVQYHHNGSLDDQLWDLESFTPGT